MRHPSAFRCMLPAAIVLALGPIPLSNLAGQRSATLQPGDRVRVTLLGLPARREVGMLGPFNADSLVIGTTRIGTGSLSRLEVSQGRKSHWLQGAAIGFLASAALITVVQVTNLDHSNCTPAVNCIAVSTIAMSIFAVPIGGLVGLLVRTERWHQVPFDRLRLASVRQGGGMGLALSLDF